MLLLFESLQFYVKHFGGLILCMNGKIQLILLTLENLQKFFYCFVQAFYAISFVVCLVMSMVNLQFNLPKKWWLHQSNKILKAARLDTTSVNIDVRAGLSSCEAFGKWKNYVFLIGVQPPSQWVSHRRHKVLLLKLGNNSGLCPRTQKEHN